MPADLTSLSIDEIRARYVDGGKPVPTRLLTKLKRDPRQGIRKLYEVLKKRHDREREERLRIDAMLNFERLLWSSGVRHVAGVDEVGMGPLAGPVIAAAVVFSPGTEILGVDDSKRVDPERRRELAREIRERALGIGIGRAEVDEIDRLNIYQAGRLAMRRAIDALPMRPDHVLVDARSIPEFAGPQNPFHKGDGINFSIAAASIVAKTHRDALMEELEAAYPGYGFAHHKGYCTAEHQDAVRRLGPCAVHRMSFQFIRELCGEFSELFYALKRELACVAAAAELKGFEQTLETRWTELADSEQRKLRVMVTRRWKTV
ncbi:MAG: ribonuclease [Candidatus Binatota bacterium]|nr:ribonuclease [Candidatus Binatota bacterium]